jgi:hypothetical protein
VVGGDTAGVGGVSGGSCCLAVGTRSVVMCLVLSLVGVLRLAGLLGDWSW